MPRSTSPFFRAALILGVAVLLLTIGPASVRADSQTYTVINTNDSGAGSLRQAILDANANPGTDTVAFNIPGAGVHTIAPTSALPEITDPVIIDGYTQPGTSPATDAATAILSIELNGLNAGSSANGLYITAGNSTVKGLVINRFARSGILLTTNGGNIIEGNYIGTNPTGTSALGNNRDYPSGSMISGGIISNGPTNSNLIGGTLPAARNIISGDNYSGIHGSAVIQGNYIGLNAQGNAAIPNGYYGTNVKNSTIGGATSGARNVIAGNIQDNVVLSGTGNLVQGNYVGTDKSGTVALGGMSGVIVSGAEAQATIGGTTPEARNVISGNRQAGITLFNTTRIVIQGNYIGTSATGTGALGNNLAGIYLVNAYTTQIGGSTTGAGNIIANNTGSGIVAVLGTGGGNHFAGNRIYSNDTLGIDLEENGPTLNDTGDADLGSNGLQNFPVLTRVQADTASSVTVDGTLNSKPDTLYRIEFFSSLTCDPSGYGEGENYLGYTEQTTDLSGYVSFSVSLSTAVSSRRFITATAAGPEGTSEFSLCVPALDDRFVVTTIDDSGPGSLRQAILDANAIPGSDVISFAIPGTGVHTITPTSPLPAITDPVYIVGTTQPGASCASWPPTLLIELSGESAGPLANGLYFAEGSGTGYPNLVTGLIINRFSAAGISVYKSPLTAYCNFTGTNAAGTAAAPNLIGIGLSEGQNSAIGGTSPTARNLISGNQDSGVVINGPTATNNTVDGNYIGADVSGNAVLANGRDGVLIDGALNTSVSGNTIANNAASGIAVVQSSSSGNIFRNNRIYNNGALGIDLDDDGPTPNDAGDADTGPNGLQNLPVLTKAYTYSATGAHVRGLLNSKPDTLYRIEFFSTTTCDPTGYGEGQTYLGYSNQTTDASGDVSFVVTFNAKATVQAFITATATGLEGTSEFSQCIAVVADRFRVFSTGDSGPGTLRQAIANANSIPGTDTISFDIPGVGVHTIAPGTALPTITQPVIIDGYTQPGASPATESSPATLLIELRGDAVYPYSTGDRPSVSLNFTASNCTVRGLVINRFANGLLFDGVAGSHNNVVEGNYIGTDPTGNIALGNLFAYTGYFKPQHNGVVIYESSNNRIGGTTPAARNVIAGHYLGTYTNYYEGTGINIFNENDVPEPTPTTGNRIQGNYIGLNAAGNTPLPNYRGVAVNYTGDNYIGGSNPGEGNVISGNVSSGVYLYMAGPNNVVQGNYIGLNADGMPPETSSQKLGVEIYWDRWNGAGGNQIGGTSAGARNIISSNSLAGILVDNTFQQRIEGNYIGTDATGAVAAGNRLAGIYLKNAGTTIIGGTVAGSGNLMAYNGSGVWVATTTTVANRILGNSIFGNVPPPDFPAAPALGIDLSPTGSYPLDGPNLNDINDLDIGPNGLQNYPVLTSAVTNTTSTVTVEGSLNARKHTSFRIEFFSNPTCDPTGYGEGKTYLGFIERATITNNDFTFNVTLNAAVPVGHYITATATSFSTYEGTSEFSLCLQTLDGRLTVTNTDDSGTGSLRQAILNANANPGIDTIVFDIPGAGVKTITPTSALPEITDPVIIDGYTQPGASPATESTTATLLIELSGGGTMLKISGGNSTVRGLVINHWTENNAGIILTALGGNKIEGCYIGLNPTGDALSSEQGNVWAGVAVETSSNGNTIGGTTPAARNVISSLNVNVYIESDNNTVQGNYIGLSAAGNAILGSPTWNLAIAGDRNLVGGTTAGARNILSSIGFDVIIVGGSENVLQGNFLGTDATGTIALATTASGVYILSTPTSPIATGNVIGGSVPGAGNVIAGNTIGILVIRGDATRIEGNTIGWSATGAPLGNAFAGIALSGAQNGVVGGTTPGTANHIANNGMGIVVMDSISDMPRSSINNRVLGNAIWSNTGYLAYEGLGLNLSTPDSMGNPSDGVTPNDLSDVDSGANGFQNFPVLTRAWINTPSTLRLTGSLNGKVSVLYRIEFFSNPTCDPSGYGEGETYLGFIEQTGNISGNVSFNVSLNAVVPVGHFITATATSTDGTSEFSQCLAAAAPPPDTIGVFRPSHRTFYLRNQNTTGYADITAVFGQSVDYPIAGDWDGDGVDTIGVYRVTTGTFFLKNANTTAAPVVYTFTLGNPGDLPMAGDWDGDGNDGVGTFRPTNGRLYLKNALTTGFADFAMVLGVNGDRPVAGDWNGDSFDSPGVYRPSNSRFYLTNQRCNCIVYADYQLLLGNVGDVGFAGDWNGDGISGVGVFRPTNGRTYLKNGLTTGFADVSMIYGIANDRPIAGKWFTSASVPNQAPVFEPGR